MYTRIRAVIAALVLTEAAIVAQTRGAPEQFTALAVVNNNIASGAGTVVIAVDRWSTEAERTTLVKTLQDKGPKALLKALQDIRPLGRIRTPDSIGYDLHYAHQMRGEDGGRRIVIATDRPIGFWEVVRGARSVDYPFTIIQMQMGPDGRGKGTMSMATKVVAYGNTIELENFATSPAMLTEIRSKKASD